MFVYLRLPLAALLLVSCAFALESPGLAQSGTRVRTTGNTMITEPAGIMVVQEMLLETGVTMSVQGSVGDTVSVGVPTTVEVVRADSAGSDSAETLVVTTNDTGAMLAGGTFVSDMVNVSIAGVIGGDLASATPGSYEGVMVVLAQYN